MKPKVREAKRTTLLTAALAISAVFAAATPALAMRDPSGSNQYADGMNLYQYVQSAPTTYVDPMGLWSLSVHKDLATSAAQPVFGNDEGFMDCIEDGAVYPDIPSGLTATGLMFLDEKVFGADSAIFIQTYQNWLSYRSHFGDLQYWHGMAAPNKNVNEMVQLLEDWIIGQCKSAVGKCGCNQAKEIGPALHTLQDLYCLSHTQRDWDNGGAIQRFQDYTKQDSSKHGTADSIEMSEGGKKRDAYNKALVATLKMLKFTKEGKCEDARTWLRNVVLKLADNAQSGGTDPAYK